MDPRVKQNVSNEYKEKAHKVIKACNCKCPEEKKETRLKSFY